MNTLLGLLFCVSALGMSLQGQTLSKETVIIETVYGKIKLKLYEETPLHKANFLKLARQKFFDSLLFHRVINNFMIQGGDALSRNAKPGDSLGHGDIGYTVPAELNTKLIHRKGALAAAREGDDVNPKFESSASQFYIVMGNKRTLEDLKKYEERINKTHFTNCARAFMKTEQGKKLKQTYSRLKTESKTDSAEWINKQIETTIQTEHLKTPEYKFNETQVKAYTGIGGTPHLDGTYTVFGEVIEGLELIDKIAGVKTDKRDRPLEDIRMKVTVLE
ncbi:MAG: peptidylprolyl isomerase [Bacteroidetes bacterium]|nr:peptidylprolyl isomerase [Bacteroidota bacterium]